MVNSKTNSSNNDTSPKNVNIKHSEELNAFLHFLSEHPKVSELNIKIDTAAWTLKPAITPEYAIKSLDSYLKSPHAKSLKNLNIDLNLRNDTLLYTLNIPTMFFLIWASGNAIENKNSHYKNWNDYAMNDSAFQLAAFTMLIIMCTFPYLEHVEYCKNHKMKCDLEEYIQKNMNLTYNGSDTECKKLLANAEDSHLKRIKRRDATERSANEMSGGF